MIDGFACALFSGRRASKIDSVPKTNCALRAAGRRCPLWYQPRPREVIMKTFAYRIAALLVAASLPIATAHAQMGGMMGQGGSQGGLKGMAGGLSGQSLTSSSMGNVAGLLQYCVSNNYLGGEDANSAKEKLTGKLPGGTASKDPGYNDGLKGLLHSSDGRQVDLSGGAGGAPGGAGAVGSSGGGAVGSGVAGGGGIQAEVTKKACNTVMSQAKSML
jgi:hypothetical protein